MQQKMLLLYFCKFLILPNIRSFLANQKARNAIFGAENLLKAYIDQIQKFKTKGNVTNSQLSLHFTSYVRYVMLLGCAKAFYRILTDFKNESLL